MGSDTSGFKSILLVDNDPLDVELTLGALEEYHLADRVAVMDDGAKALDFLHRRGEFKKCANGDLILILLDLKLPKINGLEVLKLIKKDPFLKIIPVVMFSSSRENRDLIECYNHGVSACVVKPVDAARFKRAIRQIGIFWTQINEPPPHARSEVDSAERGSATLPAWKETAFEITASHPASGG